MPDERFVGTWKLVSWRISTEDGGWRYPLGPDAKGLILYAPDGYMSASLMAAERPDFMGSDPLAGTAYECLSAMRTFHAYAGRYVLKEDRVEHKVEMCLCPNLLGSVQVRYFGFEGKDLVLTTPPLTRAGTTGTAELVWRRAVK